jgi:hypothetical protein
MATDYILQPGYDFGGEFEFGLNVILDASADHYLRVLRWRQPATPDRRQLSIRSVVGLGGFWPLGR